MILVSLARESLHSLLANRMRSALAMLGIIIGVSSVIIMIAVGQGSQLSVKRSIESLGSNLLVVTPVKATASNKKSKLTLEDAVVLRDLPSVAASAATTEPTLQSAVSGANSTLTYVVGTTPDFFRAREWPVRDGRIPTEDDILRNPRIAVLGLTAANALFEGGQALGGIVRINNVPFEVAAVLRKKGQGLDGRDQDDLIVLPIGITQQRVLGKDRNTDIQLLMVKIRSGVSLPRAMADIARTLRASRRLPPEEENDFIVKNLSELAQSALKTGRVMTLLLGAIASISLLVGGIGIMNIMYVCVTERTREIGIRKSIGARNRDILFQFLLEAAFMALLGCLMGLACGLLGVWVAKAFFGVPVAVTGTSIAAAIGTALGIGLFFGYYPARKAARMMPVEALRHQ